MSVRKEAERLYKILIHVQEKLRTAIQRSKPFEQHLQVAVNIVQMQKRAQYQKDVEGSGQKRTGT